MKLGQWVDEHARATSKNRRTVLEDLAKLAGIAFVTVEATARGARMGNYKKAMAVSEATGWVVTVVELCDENPEQAARRIAAQFPPAAV